MLYAIGACVMMHGVMYKIVDRHPDSYLLKQNIVVFEEKRSYYEWWKSEWIDYISSETECGDYK